MPKSVSEKVSGNWIKHRITLNYAEEYQVDQGSFGHQEIPVARLLQREKPGLPPFLKGDRGGFLCVRFPFVRGMF